MRPRRSSACKARSLARKGSSRTIASSRTRPRASSTQNGRSWSAIAVSSRLSPTRWIESLTPWPAEFGLERMRALLRDLGDPQRAYPSIHVVGTNGKSTATRMIEELLAREGLTVGAYYSPHVRSWSERIRVGGDDADFEGAIERVRSHAGGAT